MSPDENIMRLAASMGDPSGIGPEILLSLLIGDWDYSPVRLKVFGSRKVLYECACRLFPHLKVGKTEIHGGCIPCEIGDTGDQFLSWTPGQPTSDGARSAWEALDQAIDSVVTRESAALVTGPIHKAMMLGVGFPMPGHTDYLAMKTGVTDPVMLYDSPLLRVVLTTTHIPFRSVSEHLSIDRIAQVTRLLGEYLIRLHIPSPRIAVAALNPHGGSGDVFGDEEDRVIIPAIELFASSPFSVTGPVPADTVFHRALKGDFDGVVSLYHDQGSIPVKTLDFKNTVNVTLGLPIIRTSVDHGTAFDLAGTGTASPQNLKSAVKLAHRLAARKI
ncbi:4-hydroxythreonine-4-phosphate dehydrogenase PdxA [bacterium]|nr:4-hydroxythreonine-4-phosphate dehydrogenase PdxA [candidate division CSSED10-310 bacterium]